MSNSFFDRRLVPAASPALPPRELVGSQVPYHMVDTSSHRQVNGSLMTEGENSLKRQGGYVSLSTDDARLFSTPSENPPYDDVSSCCETMVDQTYQRLSKVCTVRQWVFEILALLVSICSFIIIVIILKTYNGRSPPRSLYLNVNTLVAVFSAVLRVTMVFVVAEVIGQSKWAWMESARPIRHIERFHDASTGAWGSLKFLFITWKPILSIIGAFVVITSNAIGPFSQQVATTGFCYDSGQEGSAQVKTTQGSVKSIWGPPMSFSAVNGLICGAADSNQAVSSLFKCTSLNCTFGPSYPAITHSSVGFCSACADVSDTLKPFDRGANGTDYQFAENTNFSLRQSDDVESRSFDMRFFPKPSRKNDKSSRGDTEPNARVSVILFTTAGCPSAEACGVGTVAANCTIYPCLRHYHSNVTDGIFQESVISQVPMDLTHTEVRENKNYSSFSRYAGVIEPCRIGKDWYNMSNISTVRSDQTLRWQTLKAGGGGSIEIPSQCLREIDYASFGDLQNFLSETVAGACKGGHHPKISGIKPWNSKKITSLTRCDKEKWWLPAMYKGGNSTFDVISDAFDGMAMAISNRMRVMDDRFVAGKEVRMFVCLKAQWNWLVYPASLLVITVGLLAVALARSCQHRRRLPVWKSAILPLLMYDIRRQPSDGKDNSASAMPLLQLSELEAVADTTMARFSSRDGAPGFIVESNESDFGKSK